MSEDTQLTVMTKTPGHRFESGHPRWGGKRKNSTQQVRDLCAELDVDPLRFLLALVKDGFTTQVIFEGGKKKHVQVTCPLELRCDLAKYISRFLYPVLSATQTQISGPDEGPIELARANTELERAMMTPGGVEIIQRAALLIAGQSDALPVLAIHAPDDGAKAPARICGHDDGREKEERGPWR
jgi:hypothetical protein